MFHQGLVISSGGIPYSVDSSNKNNKHRSAGTLVHLRSQLCMRARLLCANNRISYRHTQVQHCSTYPPCSIPHLKVGCFYASHSWQQICRDRVNEIEARQAEWRTCWQTLCSAVHTQSRALRQVIRITVHYDARSRSFLTGGGGSSPVPATRASHRSPCTGHTHTRKPIEQLKGDYIKFYVTSGL